MSSQSNLNYGGGPQNTNTGGGSQYNNDRGQLFVGGTFTGPLNFPRT